MNLKLTISIFAFLMFGLTVVKAQTSFSCVYREYCYYNKTTEKYGDCEGYEESSLFVVNKGETMFTHTTETLKSTYYVESKEYDEKNELFTYSVTSDVGNKYIWIFDPKNKVIKAIFKKEGKTVLLSFVVKAIF